MLLIFDEKQLLWFCSIFWIDCKANTFDLIWIEFKSEKSVIVFTDNLQSVLKIRRALFNGW